MTKGKLGRLILSLSALLFVAPAFADTTITLRGIGDGARTLIEVRAGVVRMGEQGAAGYSLYDKSRDLFIQVDGRNGTYMEVDRMLLRQMSAQMADMQGMMASQGEQMRAQLQNLPAEQRTMLEAQMGRMMTASPTAAGHRLRVEPRGERVVAGVNCQAYALFDGTRKAADVCMAMAGNNAIPAADYAALTAMMNLMRDMTQALPFMGKPADPLMMSDLQGVPVEMKGAANRADFSLESVSHDPLDAGRFEAYKALRKQGLMQDAMGGGMSGEILGDMRGEMSDFMPALPP